MLNVVIVERDAGYRAALEAIIRTSGDMTCVGSLPPNSKLLETIVAAQAHVVLIGVTSGRATLPQLIQRITRRFPQISVLTLADSSDSRLISLCLRAGAVGYLLRSSSWTAVCRAIRDVHQGGSSFSPRVASEVIKLFRSRSEASAPEELSGRQREIAELLRLGTRDKEIASSLNLSLPTVRSHLQTIYLKLQVNSRREAILKLNALPSAESLGKRQMVPDPLLSHSELACPVRAEGVDRLVHAAGVPLPFTPVVPPSRPESCTQAQL